MRNEEKEFLRKVANYHEGLLKPVELFNMIGEHKSEKLIHKLIAEGYIEEVPTKLHERDYTFYRVSSKGHYVFYPTHKKILISLTGDIRTIFVAVITSVITTILAIYITKLMTE